MSYIKFNQIHTVVDIGTTKICTIIAEELPNLEYSILGIGITPSHGLSKGVVVDVSKTTAAIKQSIEEASLLANYKPESLIIGASGNHIKSQYSEGMVSVKDHIVTDDIIKKAIETSLAIPLQENQRILHSIPLNYRLDGLSIIKNPLGMHAMRLEVETHIITGNVSSIENLVICCKNLGYHVEDVVLEPLASAEAILNNDEKELGALIVDIGGGTADVAFYKNGSVLFTHILTIAGNIFTNDLAIILETNHKEAERLKKEYGIHYTLGENIEIEHINGEIKTINTELISMALEARSVELAEQIKKALDVYSVSFQIPSGIILTGGGSLLIGLDKVISEITGLKTRIAIPKIHCIFKGSLEHPSYATSYGLLKYKLLQKNKHLSEMDGNPVNRLFSRMRSWLGEIF